jgi:hypothetical protein
MAFLLGPTTDVEAVQKALTKHYADALAIAPRDRKAYAPLLARILDSLDKNRDNKLDVSEIRGLNKIAPHVVLRAEFTTGNEKPTVTIVSLADELGKREDILVKKGNGFLLNMYGANLNILPESPNSRMMVSIAGIGGRSFKQLDVDKNGTLDKAEAVGDSDDRRRDSFARQFEDWDSNSDGKVTKQEHSAFLQRSRKPVESRINLKAEPVGNRLFTALDINGDNQLGLREMRSVSKRLVKLDRNGDGKISQTEVPGNVNLDLSLGDRGLLGGMVMVYREGTSLARRSVIVKGPDWFKRMDRNSDGDVTLKEFLGNAEQFKKIDKNKDGFIEPSEAIAFDKSD